MSEENPLFDCKTDQNKDSMSNIDPSNSDSKEIAEDKVSNEMEEDDKQEQTPVVLSKNQMKKLKKKEKWLAVKMEKRKHERERRKQKFKERRERGEDTGPPRKRLKCNLMENSSCKIKVAIDLSLDDYMTDKEIQSMADQLRHCYSSNRRAENPLQLYFSGSGKTKEKVDKIGDIKNWDVHVEPKPYHEAFPRDTIVYLSSDSSSVLTSLTPDKVYIIGGLVDHNRHKGLCQHLAEEKEIATAQLPIGEFFQMSTRKVLAVNHVYDILIKYTEILDWKQAFLSEMPQRKAETLKEKDLGSSKGASNSNEITEKKAETQEENLGSSNGTSTSNEKKEKGLLEPNNIATCPNVCDSASPPHKKSESETVQPDSNANDKSDSFNEQTHPCSDDINHCS